MTKGQYCKLRGMHVSKPNFNPHEELDEEFKTIVDGLVDNFDSPGSEDGEVDNNIEWVKIEAGEYRSKDERFHIYKSWDRIHGNSWQLTDLETKQILNYDTLKQCKRMAETLLSI